MPNVNHEMLMKARRFAVDSHGDQQYGSKPYVYHLDTVANLLKPYGETAQVIGYLHDVIEDTRVDVKDLEKEFGQFISLAVDLITDPPGSNRKSRKEKANEKLRGISGNLEIALVVKVADRLANIKASLLFGNMKLLSMYKKEHDQFKLSTYRKGLCNEFWIQLDQVIAPTLPKEN